MQKQFRALWQSRFIQQVSTLASGTVIAHAVTLILLPVLGRLYEVGDFGIQGLFIAVINSLAIGLNGGYEMTIMLPTTDREAKHLLQLSTGIAVGFTGIVWGGLVLSGSWIWHRLDMPELYSWQLLLVGGLLIEGLSQPLRVMLNRLQKYKVLSGSRVAQAFVSNVTMLVIGYLDGGFYGLLVGFIAGQAAGFAVLVAGYLLWKERTTISIDWQMCRELAYTYRDFPTKGLWAGWLNAISRQLPFYLLPAFFSQEAAGFYTVANRALMSPFSLLSRSVGEVFYEKAARAKEEGKQVLGTLTRQTATYLSLAGLVPLLVVLVAGPFLVTLIFGETWRTTGEYAQYLMPWVYLMFVASPLSYLIDVQRRLGFLLRYNIALFGLRLAALLIGGYFLVDSQTVMLYSALGSFMVAFHIRFLLKIGHVWER
ncbi:MAG: oligosaccharide flippase family protein [Bacteroidota bacterium]